MKLNKKGFTLIEMIVVLIIIAVLAAVGIPSMLNYVSDASKTVCFANRQTIMRGYTAFRLEHPSTTLEAFILNKDLYAGYGNDGVCPNGGAFSALDNKALICDIHSEDAYHNSPDAGNIFTDEFNGAIATSTWGGSSNPTHSADKAFDTAKNTRWASVDSTVNSSLTVTLKENCRINEISIMQHTDRIASYKIEYLKPGTTDTWILLTSGGPIQAGPQTAMQANNATDAQREFISDFGNIVTSQLRFSFERKADTGGVSIWDIQAVYKG